MESTTNGAEKIPVLYVEKKEKGTSAITATPAPGAEWPVDGETKYPIWSGSGGAVDSKDPVKYVLALDTAGSYTISASCGNTVAIKVLVLELAHETIAKTPLDRKRTKLGIGEKVKFSILPLKATTKAASIEVSVQIGECKLSETFSVVAPSSIYMEQFPNTQVKHITGTASCGFIGAVYLRPDDVSFSEVEIQEQEAPAITSGCFTSAQGQMHELGAWEEESDNTWPGKGTYVAPDTVWSGADFTGPTFIDGQFTWYIPVKFRVKKESSSGTVFTVLIHHMALSGADGSMRISKNGVSFSRKASDPTTDYQ